MQGVAFNAGRKKNKKNFSLHRSECIQQLPLPLAFLHASLELGRGCMHALHSQTNPAGKQIKHRCQVPCTHKDEYSSACHEAVVTKYCPATTLSLKVTLENIHQGTGKTKQKDRDVKLGYTMVSTMVVQVHYIV